jgi:4-hydroxy-tetrahydrodipicolinate reductase
LRADPLQVGVIGATGRLGSRLAAECARRGVPVVLAASRGPWQATSAPTVVLDASRGAVLPRTAQYCRDTGAGLIACASDLGQEELRTAEELSREVPVVRAVNLSVGHWLQRHLLGAAARIARALPDRPCAGVLERHPVSKRDRPSATARSLAETWRTGSGDPVHEVASYRAGHAVSEHLVELTFEHESLTFRHDVRDLRAACYGALAAASWAHDAPPGWYPINDLFDRLFLREAR